MSSFRLSFLSLLFIFSSCGPHYSWTANDSQESHNQWILPLSVQTRLDPTCREVTARSPSFGWSRTAEPIHTHTPPSLARFALQQSCIAPTVNSELRGEQDGSDHPTGGLCGDSRGIKEEERGRGLISGKERASGDSAPLMMLSCSDVVETGWWEEPTVGKVPLHPRAIWFPAWNAVTSALFPAGFTRQCEFSTGVLVGKANWSCSVVLSQWGSESCWGLGGKERCQRKQSSFVLMCLASRETSFFPQLAPLQSTHIPLPNGRSKKLLLTTRSACKGG